MFPALSDWRASWRHCWAPTMSDAELLALVEALACDDARICQGTVVDCRDPWTEHNACRACMVGAAALLTRGPLKGYAVGLDYFRRLELAEARGEAAGVSAYSFLRFVDEEPWPVVRAGCLGEFQRAMGMRALGQAEISPGAVVLIAS